MVSIEKMAGGEPPMKKLKKDKKKKLKLKKVEELKK